MVIRCRLRFRRAAMGAMFVAPLDETLRTAILVGGFRETRSIRVFPGGWSDAVVNFRPSAIAAPLQYLRRLAAQAGSLILGHAIIAFTDSATLGVSDSDRDLLWQAFGVPVFEQYLGSHNELLAAECEAHAGLHVVSGCGHLPLDHTRCACGNASPRVVGAVAAPILEPVLDPVLVS